MNCELHKNGICLYPGARGLAVCTALAIEITYEPGKIVHFHNPSTPEVKGLQFSKQIKPLEGGGGREETQIKWHLSNPFPPSFSLHISSSLFNSVPLELSPASLLYVFSELNPSLFYVHCFCVLAYVIP